MPIADFDLPAVQAAFGLQRLVFSTGVGPIVVRVGERVGSSATLLLHGAAGSWTTWIPLLEASRRAHRPLRDVVLVDLPGWGESPGPVPELADLSHALRTILRDLGYERWEIVGHSLGGFIALDLAARTPRETDGVVLVSPSGVAVQEATRRRIHGGLRLPGFAGMLAAMSVLRGIGMLAAPLLRALDAVGALPLLAAPLFADPTRVDVRILGALAGEIRPRAFVAAAEQAADYDETLWRGVRCPVRSVRGDRDVFAGSEDAEAFAALIPDFRESRVTDAGHFAHVEDPHAVATALTGLAEARRAREVALQVQRPRAARTMRAASARSAAPSFSMTMDT